MNRGMLCPILGVIAVTAYGAYELINHDYDKNSLRLPVLPNGILEIDPKSQELSKNPEQGKSSNLVDVKISQKTDTNPRVNPISAPLASSTVESREEKTPKNPSNEATVRAIGKAQENASPIVSEQSNSSSSANLISPVASSNAGERYGSAATSSQKKDSGYEPDARWFNKVGKHSMAYKYKDHMLLVSENHPVGKEKNKKIKDMIKKTQGGIMGSYGKGYVKESDIHENFASQFCKIALEYSEGTTFGTMGISKKYLDFLGTVCGRDDQPKPKDWWWR